MKTWFKAAAKFTAEFLILLALFSAAAAFAATVDAPGVLAFGLEVARAALGSWPLALAIAVGLGMVSWRSATGGRLAVLLSVLLFGFLFAGAGTVTRELVIVDAPARDPAPVLGRAVANEDLLVSVATIKDGLARRVVAVDWSGSVPRLAWANVVTYKAASRNLELAGKTWSLRPRAVDMEAWSLPTFVAERLDLAGIRALDAASLRGGTLAPLQPPFGILHRLALAMAFVLLTAGLAAPSLALRRPLAAFIFSLVAVSVAIVADGWLAASPEPGLLADELARLGLAIDGRWIVPILEAIVGALVAGFGLAVGRTGSGARIGSAMRSGASRGGARIGGE
jgi:hypothetical protein